MAASLAKRRSFDCVRYANSAQDENYIINN
jgi:hypothetical protein